jgi:hypothetical protein
VLWVDPPEYPRNVHRFLEWEVLKRYQRYRPMQLKFRARGLAEAQAVLKSIAGAELVITGNVDCATAAVEIGCPVILISRGGSEDALNHVGWDRAGNVVAHVAKAQGGRVRNVAPGGADQQAISHAIHRFYRPHFFERKVEGCH